MISLKVASCDIHPIAIRHVILCKSHAHAIISCTHACDYHVYHYNIVSYIFRKCLLTQDVTCEGTIVAKGSS